MSSEQKKFAPELMGGTSLATRVRRFLGSILDIGKSARFRLSRMTNPDYDLISDIVTERDNILGHKFDETIQKRAIPQDETIIKASKAVKQLEEMDDEKFDVIEPAIHVPEFESPVSATPTDSAETVEVAAPVEIIVDTPAVSIQEGEFFPDVPATVAPIELVDEVADMMRTVDDWIFDSGEIFDDVREFDLIRNVISIIGHDSVIEQMKIDNPVYEPFTDKAPDFPEVRPTQKQTTLYSEKYISKDVPETPWYTDADLIRIAIRAATEDCIETITPMMEEFDEPVFVDASIPDVDAELTEMAVKAMTEDAIETVVARIAQAAKVAEIISTIPETVDEPVVEVAEVEPIVEDIIPSIVQAAKVAESIMSASVDIVEPVSDGVEEGPIVDVQPSIESMVSDVPVQDTSLSACNGACISFRFGTGMASTTSVGIKFRFGLASQ